MDKELVIQVPMPDELHVFLVSSRIAEIDSVCYKFLNTLLEIGSAINNGDEVSIDTLVKNLLVELVKNHIDMDMNYFKDIITRNSLHIFDIIISHGLIDYKHYISDYNRNRISVRVYKLGIVEDIDKGVHVVI